MPGPMPRPMPAPIIITTTSSFMRNTTLDAKLECGSLCYVNDFCCNNPDIGMNQQFSCSQACMLRFLGATEQECLELVKTQSERPTSCTSSYGSYTFSFCEECVDLTQHSRCYDGANIEASQMGCTMILRTSSTG